MKKILVFMLACAVLHAEDDEMVAPPKSFAREVMQPIGMPVVNIYHLVKESPFLNTARKEATGLEALGDFFLTPSRYLFGGSSPLSYEKHDGLKTAFSIVAFPVTEILGCAFKGASLLSKETRDHYSKLYQENSQVISQLEFYKSQGITTFFSEKIAPCLKLVRPSIVPEKHQLEIKAFKEISKHLNANGIVFWLDCGSCLGTYRYGGMIPWDDDVDISIISADHENVKKILSKLDPDRFQIQDWSSYKHPQTFLKLYIKETKTLIDIYHYRLDPTTRTASYFFTFKDSAIPDQWKKGEIAMTKPIPYDVLFPLQKATFDGITTWVPNNLEAFLHLKYGENLTPTMIWDEKSQGYKKVKDHPYWKMIE